MPAIKHLKIQGFRRLADIDLEVRPFMVLLGANGAGKTSLLDACGLLAASASGGLQSRLSDLGGISSVITRGPHDEVAFETEMDVPGHEPLVYQLKLQPSGTSYRIHQESLSQARTGFAQPFLHLDAQAGRIRYYNPESKKLMPPDWSHAENETALSQVPKMFHHPEEFRRALSSTIHYHALDVGPRAPVKLPQPMKPATHPGANGEDLVPYLYYLKETDPDRFDTLIDTLRSGFPSFDTLRFPPVAAGVLTLTWHDRHYPKPFYLHELSEGTLRFLWLISLLLSPTLSTVTMIDEPEVSLHPELLALLAELMREASRRTNLIVATHSDRFVRFLQPGELVVLDSDDDATKARWADSLDLDAWMAEYSMDELWQMGRLGARA